MFQVQYSDRIRGLATGIFSELAGRKQIAIEKGIQLIDLSVGSPDLEPPQIVVDTLLEGIQDKSRYGYAIKSLPSFHQAVVNFYQNRYEVALDADHEVLQLMGSHEGLSHLAIAILNPGDVVLVPDPGYPIYEASVQIAGGEIYPMPLLEENGYLPQLDLIPQEILRRAKLMILNYPGNPVTAMASVDFFEQAVEFAKKHQILVAHDFAYSELVFDGVKPVSFLQVAGAKEVGIEFNSLSKTFNMAGCRIGYAVGNRDALHALSLLKSHIDYGIFYPIQQAAVAALTADYEPLAMLAENYQKRRDVLLQELETGGWHVPKSQATMFVWAKIPLPMTSREFVYGLIEEQGVIVTPGDAFGARGEGYVRIALVQSEGVLAEAACRISNYLKHRVF